MRRLFVLACLALAGCADLPMQLQPGIEHVVREAVEAARAPAAQQKALLARAQSDFVRDPAPTPRVKLAALLATLPAPLRDDARALELLEPLVAVDSPAGRLAALLAAQVADRQRLAREVERLAKERADAEREAQNAEKERQAAEKERQAAEKERQSADKERDKREEALRQQLEALRAIERGILEREERLRKKPGGKP